MHVSSDLLVSVLKERLVEAAQLEPAAQRLVIAARLASVCCDERRVGGRGAEACEWCVGDCVRSGACLVVALPLALAPPPCERADVRASAGA